MVVLGGVVVSHERGTLVTQVRGLSATRPGDGPVDDERALAHKKPPTPLGSPEGLL